MLPKNNPTERTQYLQDTLKAATTEELSKWPQPTGDDLKLIGSLISVYSNIDFQLHRIVAVLQRRGIFKGRLDKLTLWDLAKIAQGAPDWTASDLETLKEIEKFRPTRNLFGH